MAGLGRRILAPHKEQDGFVYIRVPSAMADTNPERETSCASHIRRWPHTNRVYYDDTMAGSRAISSRRVERAVETDDYLRLCAEEGLSAMLQGGYWFVSNNWSRGGYRMGHDHEAHYAYFHRTMKDDGDPDDFMPSFAGGRTLREAYHRYHAAVGDAK